MTSLLVGLSVLALVGVMDLARGIAASRHCTRGEPLLDDADDDDGDFCGRGNALVEQRGAQTGGGHVEGDLMGRLTPPRGETLYRVLLDGSDLPAFCDRLQALPGFLLPVVLAGLYRPVPHALRPRPGSISIRGGFSDLLDSDLILVRLRCTRRVRAILEEYRIAGPFEEVLDVIVSWQSSDRFSQVTQGEFWSLARCLARAGVHPVHWCAGVPWQKRAGD